MFPRVLVGFLIKRTGGGQYVGALALSPNIGDNGDPQPAVPFSPPTFPHSRCYYVSKNTTGTPSTTTLNEFISPKIENTIAGFLDFSYVQNGAAQGWIRRVTISSGGSEYAVATGGFSGSQADVPEPEITIGNGDSFLVTSGTDPWISYEVPLDYSSCTCPDFTQEKDDKSWVGSAAGPFNPCKHIMAVKRRLQIPQFYTDYTPARLRPPTRSESAFDFSHAEVPQPPPTWYKRPARKNQKYYSQLPADVKKRLRKGFR